MNTHFNIGWQTLWRIFFFGAMLFVAYLAREVVSVLLISIILSIGFDPLVSLLQRIKIPRILGTIITFLFVLALLTLAVYGVIPVVEKELGGFLAHLSKALSEWFDFQSPFIDGIRDFKINFGEILGILSAAQVSLTTAVGELVRRGALFIATIMISFYLTIDQNGIERLLRVVLPKGYENSALQIFDCFKIKIRRWFGAQLVLSLFIGVMAGVGLWILGVKYPLVIGILAALFELVPMIGPILAGAVAFFVALSDSSSLALYTLIYFLVIQQIENHLLVPLVMGKAIKVHPVVVIFALLIGGKIAGIIGIVLAVPVAVFLQEIVEYIASKKIPQVE